MLSVHGRYQLSWLWSDETLAVYLNMTFTGARAPYCAAFRGGTAALTVVTCDEKGKAAYLCALDFQPTAEAANTTGIFFPAPAHWTRESMATCPLNHTTHNFLACDAKSNCFAADQTSSRKCADLVPSAGPYFTCRNQVERVPYSLVCMGRRL